MATVEITGTTYENGKRISHQRVIYNKSDDLLALTQLYRALESTETRLNNTTDAEIRKDLLAEKTKLCGQIAAKEEIINGYNTAENTEN